MNKIDVFLDLDGVVFKYDMVDYIGDNPKYKQEGYFKTRPLDENAYEMLKRLNDSDEVENIYILSSAIIEGYTIEQNKVIADDKTKNVMYHIPWFPKENIIIAIEKTKPETVREVLKRQISTSDILIDDFNRNLKEWEKAGGSAIKYINNINSESDEWPNIKGCCLSQSEKGSQYEIIKRAIEIV